MNELAILNEFYKIKKEFGYDMTENYPINIESKKVKKLFEYSKKYNDYTRLGILYELFKDGEYNSNTINDYIEKLADKNYNIKLLYGIRDLMVETAIDTSYISDFFDDELLNILKFFYNEGYPLDLFKEKYKPFHYNYIKYFYDKKEDPSKYIKPYMSKELCFFSEDAYDSGIDMMKYIENNSFNKKQLHSIRNILLEKKYGYFIDEEGIISPEYSAEKMDFLLKCTKDGYNLNKIKSFSDDTINFLIEHYNSLFGTLASLLNDKDEDMFKAVSFLTYRKNSKFDVKSFFEYMKEFNTNKAIALSLSNDAKIEQFKLVDDERLIRLQSELDKMGFNENILDIDFENAYYYSLACIYERLRNTTINKNIFKTLDKEKLKDTFKNEISNNFILLDNNLEIKESVCLNGDEICDINLYDDKGYRAHISNAKTYEQELFLARPYIYIDKVYNEVLKEYWPELRILIASEIMPILDYKEKILYNEEIRDYENDSNFEILNLSLKMSQLNIDYFRYCDIDEKYCFINNDKIINMIQIDDLVGLSPRGCGNYYYTIQDIQDKLGGLNVETIDEAKRIFEHECSMILAANSNTLYDVEIFDEDDNLFEYNSCMLSDEVNHYLHGFYYEEYKNYYEER